MAMGNLPFPDQKRRKNGLEAGVTVDVGGSYYEEWMEGKL